MTDLAALQFRHDGTPWFWVGSVTKRIQKPKKTELKSDWGSKRRSEKEGDEEERDDGGAEHEDLGSP